MDRKDVPEEEPIMNLSKSVSVGYQRGLPLINGIEV